MTITLWENSTIYQRRGTGRTVPCFGTCDGRPVEVRAVGLDGAPATAWAAATVTGTAFVGVTLCPTGPILRFEARYVGDDATTSRQAHGWSVGIHVWVLGQSNAKGLFYWGSPQSSTACVYQKDGEQGVSDAWAYANGNGVCAMADRIRQSVPGLPVAFVNMGVNGSSIGQWLDLSPQSPWGRFVPYFQRLGGDAEFIVWVQGEDDMRLGTPKPTYKSALSALQQRLQALAARPDQKFMVVQTGSVTYPNVSEAAKQAVRDAQAEWSLSTPNAFWGGSCLSLPTSDGMHLTRDAAGTGRLGEAIGQQIAARL